MHVGDAEIPALVAVGELFRFQFLIHEEIYAQPEVIAAIQRFEGPIGFLGKKKS